MERLAPKPWLKTIQGCFGDSDQPLQVTHVDTEVEKLKYLNGEITGEVQGASTVGYKTYCKGRYFKRRFL